jgi:hypothetical protein
VAVTVPEAANHLRIPAGTEGQAAASLALFVAAANEWVEGKVTATAPAGVVKLAELELIRHWWEKSQRGPASAPAVDETYVDIDGRAYAIPNDVRELIEDFLASSSTPAPVGCFPDARGWPDPVEWPA